MYDGEPVLSGRADGYHCSWALPHTAALLLSPPLRQLLLTNILGGIRFPSLPCILQPRQAKSSVPNDDSPFLALPNSTVGSSAQAVMTLSISFYIDQSIVSRVPSFFTVASFDVLLYYMRSPVFQCLGTGELDICSRERE